MELKAYKIIETYEREIASVEGRKNTERLAFLLHDDFEEIGSSGKVFFKKDTLSLLPKMTNVHYVLSDFVFKNLCEKCILVKYTTQLGVETAFRTSIWVEEGMEWKLIHHQATVVPS